MDPAHPLGLELPAFGADPLAALAAWLEAARAGGEPEPEAMALATVTAAGEPQVRMVLLKRVDARGLTFFSNYRSDKGRQLAAVPRAAVALFWPGLHRQVRCSGAVGRTPRAESLAYFSTRPYGAQVSAAISPQSRPVPSRGWLEERSRVHAARHPDTVPLPAGWGGYRLRPDRVEFWQGRPDRLHDRLRFTRAEGGWQGERLAP